MKVTQKNVDDLTLTLTIGIDKNDYSDKRKKILSDYRRKADIKGFRKGMAPMSLIEKLHGRNALLDAVNGLISDGLNNHIRDNQINIIGEPLPNTTEQKEIDWETAEEFEFVFDVALAPKVDLKIDNSIKVPYYEVEISKEAKAEYRSNLLKQHGKLENTEVIENDDFVIVDLVQGETRVEGTYVALRSVSEAAKAEFIGKKAGDSFDLDVNKAFENETDRAAMLKVKKEELEGMDPIFNVTIKEVKRFAEAVADKDLFDRLFGEGVVNNEDEFDAKIVERMKGEYAQESDYRFMLDARDTLIEKAAIKLPEEFLKRWLYTVNEGKFTMEEIEKDFHLFAQDFRWQMIRESVKKDQSIEVKREDLVNHAKKVAAYQFAMYGLPNVPEQQLNQYAESLLANEKEGRRIYEKVEDDLVLDYVRSVVTLESKPISIDELHKLTN
ncbi:MAG: trigger factor [Bacteroidales bacterium]